MQVVILVRLTGRLNFKWRRTRATQEREGLGLTDSTQLAVCRMHGVTDRTSFIWLFKWQVWPFILSFCVSINCKVGLWNCLEISCDKGWFLDIGFAGLKDTSQGSFKF